jgi:hypothetical protein
MSTTTKSGDIIGTMAEWFEKFPPLPKNWRDTLARIAPILSLIFGVLGIIVAIGGLGVLSATSPLAFLGGAQSVSTYGTGILATLIYLVGSILLLASYPGLKARKYKGWTLLFWSEVVNLIGGLVSLAILSAIIGALIGFYLIFQIRSYYK